MFWKRKKEEIKSDLELPSLDQLEKWVSVLIRKLDLKEGTFTILPAFGGILLFVRDQGLSWIPNAEIKEAMGKVDPVRVAEATATLGGVAAVVATGGFIPILLVHGLKGSYRTIAKPPPVISRSYLKSMIKEVTIQEKKIPVKLLKKIEQDPFTKGKEEGHDTRTHLVSITRKFLDLPKPSSKAYKVLDGLKSFLIRSVEPEFLIPSQSDILTFAKILEENQISVRWEKKMDLDNEQMEDV
ncbi:MAG: hypothetical protein ACXAD7_07785 [Candidatus Kariarchaeaceae archaeon]